MATRHRIDEALTSERMGDVEKYFHNLVTMIDANSGEHDFKMITTDCYNVNAPFKADRFTTFQLTDRAVDIVDISKGFIHMKVNVDVQFLYKDASKFTDSNELSEACYMFVGLKNSACLINNYNIISNGRMTSCKNTKAKHEQAINYMCKSKEERAGRPGMYSPHDKVRKMSDCVCGTYIKLPSLGEKDSIKPISFDVVIQIDDLLPFAALSYFPRFICQELELQLSCNLIQNMVFCQVPFKSVIEKICENNDQFDMLSNAIIKPTMKMDCRFTQCGDYAEGLLAYGTPYESSEYTINVSNLEIIEAKSYVYGFNIKEDTKANLYREFQTNNFVVPAQWIEHYTLSQLPTVNNIRTNIQVPMFNCTQVIFTFPNSGNQLTVSRNPHLEAVQCHISDRIIPDKFFNTLDKQHSEMTLANLNLDSLFTAPDELIESLIKDRKEYDSWTLKKIDDSDYMLVFNLERFGNGCYCDGMTGNPIPINLTANYMKSTRNPHYYDKNGKLQVQNINMFIVQDSFWQFGPDGGRFIKDEIDVQQLF